MRILISAIRQAKLTHTGKDKPLLLHWKMELNFVDFDKNALMFVNYDMLPERQRHG